MPVLAPLLTLLLGPAAPASLVRSIEPGAPPAAPSAAPMREVTALPADPLMRVDGVLDEPCWQSGLWVDAFILSDGTGRRPEAPTLFSVRFDAASVYIGVRAAEPNMALLKTTEGATHDEKAFNDDCLEVWLDPDDLRRQAYHLIYSVAGGAYDALQQEELRDDPTAAGPGVKRLVYSEDTSWDGHGEAAFVRAEGGWTAEVRAPVRDLGLEAVIPGSSWGFNIARERYALPGGGAEYSSFSGAFCQPMSSFASLRLGLAPVEVTALSFGGMGVGENSLSLACRSARGDLPAVDVRLTVRAGEETSLRESLPLEGAEAQTRALSYRLPAAGPFAVELDLLRPGTDELLFRKTVRGRLDAPLRLHPRSPVAYPCDDPWWVDLELLVGDRSRSRGALLVTARKADGRSIARQRIRKLEPSMRLHLGLGSLGGAGDYALTFTVLDGKSSLGEASVPLRLLRPPGR